MKKVGRWKTERLRRLVYQPIFLDDIFEGSEEILLKPEVR